MYSMSPVTWIDPGYFLLLRIVVSFGQLVGYITIP